MATSTSFGDGSVLVDSRFSVSHGAEQRIKALSECLFFLKVQRLAGSCGKKGLLFECSKASKVVAFDCRAVFRNTALFRSTVGRFNFVSIFEEGACCVMSKEVSLSDSARLTRCKRCDVSR